MKLLQDADIDPAPLYGKRIAVQIALLFHNKLYILKSGYDPHYAAFAPSLILCEMMLREAWSTR